MCFKKEGLIVHGQLLGELKKREEEDDEKKDLRSMFCGSFYDINFEQIVDGMTIWNFLKR